MSSIFDYAWQNPVKWLLRARQIRSTSDANMEHAREEKSTWVFRFRVGQVCSLSSQIKFGNALQNPINWPLRDIEMKSTSTAIFTFRREKSWSTFLFTSKGLMLEGLTTFMDCCLRTRASNVFYRNEVDYLGGIDWMAAEEDVLCRTPLIAVVIV